MSIENKPKERREHKRATIEIPVTYSYMNTFFYDYINNISLGGTFIRTANPLPVGTRFRFIIRLSDSPEEINLSAEVIWIREQDEQVKNSLLPAGMGIEFIFSSEQERLDFQKKVERMIRDKLGDRIAKRLLMKKD